MKKLSNISKLLTRFLKDCKEFSIKVGYARLYRDCPWIAWEKRREKYEIIVYDYLKKEYSDLIKGLKNTENGKRVKNSENIWVMWWQGEKGMPPIVNACYQQLKKVAYDKKIVLLTQENVYDYVTIPDDIKKKVTKGQITLTHFSDIVRVILLEKYGGLWIDATVYVTSLPKEFFNQEFFTLRKHNLFPEFISRGDWSTYLLLNNGANKLFQCIKEVYFVYWKEHNEIIDYLMLDFIIKLIWDTISEVQVMFNRVSEIDGFYDLNLKLNDTYNENEWKEICEKSYFHKLTYKKEFVNFNKEGKETYYHWLIHRK